MEFKVTESGWYRTRTAFEDQVICVHCGYEYLDSWELNERCGERITCNKCNNEMLLHVNYEVTYATSKIPQKST